MEWLRESLVTGDVDIVVSFKSAGANSQVPRPVDWWAAHAIETETIVPLATMCLA